MSRQSNYLSISDILVTNEKIPCKFLHDLPKMGFLDPSSTEDDLKLGTNVEIPLWLAESLYFRKPPLVSVDLPKIYKEAYREILNADACTVDLHKLGQHFYELGCYIAKHDIKGEVANTLINTFRQRFRMILSASCSTDSISSLQPLSESERERTAAAAVTEKALSLWLQRGDCPLSTANMVASHRKRKRAEMEMF
ncbi:PREDICTED: DNA replication complex GINS protein PSF3 [Papilio xuthus]|uniref:DNA replication complex GINS protein PSF3 n=1 Tax=Papilio xuthus TaxID=66420 RepID=A0A194QD03_PAPXU|nr:PREDICTED: DNA replication complex GINS protein PSF3 [Papilio xuthus]KPJ03299.1 DNA replication complex GINS protein PSF3 [Papilio xuthus]